MAERWEMPAPGVLPPALRPFVAAMHGYAAEGLTPGVHRGLPGRALTVVLSIGDPLGVATTEDDWATGRIDRQQTVLGGLHTAPAWVEQPGRWCGVQLDVNPLGARRLFGVPAAALPTASFDARELLGPDLEVVEGALAAARTWDARYAVVTAFLLDRLAASDGRRDGRRRVRREVVEAWRWLGDRRGAGSVAEVSEHVGVGRRRLAQLFGVELGVTPKTAARLMRFDAARRVVAQRAVAGADLDLTDVAVAHGYYDHAHLVRDFTEFTGLSPTAWVQAERANVQAGADVDAAGSDP